jgi:uncharacterized membrane protein
MRGSTVHVCRTAKDNGRLWVEVEHYVAERVHELPQDEDCKASCFAMWRFDPADVMADAKLSSEPGVSKNGSIFT